MLAALVTLAPARAGAFPGQPRRLGGVEAQGAATRAITALHHNPAMLAGIERTGIHASFSTGLDQRWIRRFEVDADGAPGATSGDQISLVNPVFDYFVGATLFLDPFAIGAGVYTLGNEFHLVSTDSLRYHLAPEPDVAPLRCDGSSESCPLNGGAATVRTDFTLAFAWNVLSSLKIGLGVHFPRLRTRFAHDYSTELGLGSATQGNAPNCNQVEDPRCAERLGFSGVTRWLPGTSTRPSGFDIALTLGVAYDITDRATLGLRYRTRPLLRGGEITVAGDGLVCVPDDESETMSGATHVPRCSVANANSAVLVGRMPRELAIGGAFVIGRSKQWRLDTNLYWVDLCHDSLGEASGVTECADPGGQRLTLFDRDPQSTLLPETVLYRGLQDMFGADVYTTYRMRSNIALLLGAHTSSPGVRRSALVPSNSDSWRVGLSLGAVFRLRQSNFQLVPGYGVDVFLPSTVTAQAAAFDPTAGTEFGDANGDINAPHADVVLEGRARPSNAARYIGATHTFTLGIRWAERGLGVN